MEYYQYTRKAANKDVYHVNSLKSNVRLYTTKDIEMARLAMYMFVDEPACIVRVRDDRGKKNHKIVARNYYLTNDFKVIYNGQKDEKVLRSSG